MCREVGKISAGMKQEKTPAKNPKGVKASHGPDGIAAPGVVIEAGIVAEPNVSHGPNVSHEANIPHEANVSHEGAVSVGDASLNDEERARLTAQIGDERRRLSDLVSSVPGVVWEAWGEPDAGS
ncbi:MAG: hypothetical protein QOJ76_122, partial [Acidobacteriota bacterium]|nr:hypothetical protein [Acidobacteriota bacterium]